MSIKGGENTMCSFKQTVEPIMKYLLELKIPQLLIVSVTIRKRLTLIIDGGYDLRIGEMVLAKHEPT